LRTFRSKKSLLCGEQITEENMDDLAEWCGGTVKVYEPEVHLRSGNYRRGQKYIEFFVRDIQVKAFLGNWLTCVVGQNDFGVYRSDSLFFRLFEEVGSEATALNEANDPLGIMAMWARVPDVPLGNFLTYVDLKLLEEIIGDPIGDMRAAFEYFNSNTEKPLMPREFLKFWTSLTAEEQMRFMPRTKMTGILSVLDADSVVIERWGKENP
jgi:hypothetical protein